MTDRARLSIWGGLVAFLITLAWYGRASGVEPDPDVLYEWATAAQGAVIYAFILGVVVVAASGRVRELLALRAPASWPRAAGAAAIALVAIFVIANLLLDPVLDAGEEQGLTPPGWEPDRAAQYVVNSFVVAGLVPLVEELTFRGVGFSLLRRWGEVTAIVVTAVLFALAHGLVRGLPIFIVFGLAIGWLRARTDSIYPCIGVHMAFNAMALIAAVTIES